MAPYLGLRGRRLTSLISLVSGAAFFLFGYDQADFGDLLTLASFRHTFPDLDTIGNPTRHTALVQGIANAAWNLGCVLSAISTIWVAGALGRKKTIFTGVAVLILGEVIQASSFSLGQLIAGRVVAGIGNGFTTAAIPAYQAETTRAHRRGTHLMTSALCIAAGAACAFWLDFAFAYTDPSSAAWRVPIAFQLVIAVPLLPLLAFLPESPRWLILTGRAEEALTVLSALQDASTEDTHVYKEFLAIKDSVLEASAGGFGDVVTQGKMRHLHRTVLACCIQAFQQVSGINLVVQYAALVFLSGFGYAGWSARLLAACLGTFGTLASMVPVVGIDNFWGRRSLMLFGSAGMCAAMVVVSAMAWVQGAAGQSVGTIFVFVFVGFFAVGWQGIPWLYSVEVVPLRVRGPATALSTGVNWLMNFWVVLITPLALHNITYRTYIIFAVLNLAVFPAVYFFFPECAYRTLEEMDVIFHAAALSKTPYTTVVRDSREAPLWYGRDGAKEFDYEGSEWHRSKVRFSDEVTTSGSEGSGSEEKAKEGWSSDEEVGALPETMPRREVRSRNDMAAGHPLYYKMGRESRSSGRA